VDALADELSLGGKQYLILRMACFSLRLMACRRGASALRFTPGYSPAPTCRCWAHFRLWIL